MGGVPVAFSQVSIFGGARLRTWIGTSSMDSIKWLGTSGKKSHYNIKNINQNI
jgi:hypothetical protein